MKFGFFKLFLLLAWVPTAPSCVAIVYCRCNDRQLQSRSVDGGNNNDTDCVSERKKSRIIFSHIVVLFKKLDIYIEKVQPINAY